jgi:hypothetical protein
MVDVPPGRVGGADERSTVSGGDAPTSAGISPADASALRRSLAGLDREPATFEVTVADDPTDDTRLCWSVSVVDGESGERASLRCVPLAPGEPAFHVGVDDLASLSVVDLPRERFLGSAETPAERATAHRRLATAAPRTASVAHPLGLLDRDDVSATVQRDATRALREIARCRPTVHPPCRCCGRGSRTSPSS